jgi:LmbE family N-acetylglucosaminyl deacetylase
MITIRARFQKNLWRRFLANSTIMGERDLGSDAVLFSPHQDDETLGCGGTLLKKTAVGANVSLVFMTDGCSSHGHLTSQEALKDMRRQEALEAGGVLGVPSEKIFFLDHLDGQLSASQEQAVRQVSDLLQELKPKEVYVPYFDEPPSDHAVTYQIVRAALQGLQQEATIFEYPVWFWFQWPWIGLRQESGREYRALFRNTWRFQFGQRLLTDFQSAVYIGDVLQRKYAALQAHRSQMEKMNDNPDWMTLQEISRGQYLECFFRDYEIFNRYLWRPEKGQSKDE